MDQQEATRALAERARAEMELSLTDRLERARGRIIAELEVELGIGFAASVGDGRPVQEGELVPGDYQCIANRARDLCEALRAVDQVLAANRAAMPPTDLHALAQRVLAAAQDHGSIIEVEDAIMRPFRELLGHDG